MKIADEPLGAEVLALPSDVEVEGAAALPGLIMILIDTAHPTIVPLNTRNWIANATSVERDIPKSLRSLLIQKRCRFCLARDVVDAEAEPTTVVVADSVDVEMELDDECVETDDPELASAGGGASRSAGCRSGIATDSVLADEDSCPWISSLKPISPRLEGRGPAWGRWGSVVWDEVAGLVAPVLEDATPGDLVPVCVSDILLGNQKPLHNDRNKKDLRLASLPQTS
jgi:hypothetical protein